MEWYHYLLIVLGSLIVASLIVFLILYINNNKKNKDNRKQEDELYNTLINLLGGYTNIIEVSINSSRLSLTLNDTTCLTSEKLTNFVKDNGIGMVKASKKVTLVIGDLASKYYKQILDNIQK